MLFHTIIAHLEKKFSELMDFIDFLGVRPVIVRAFSVPMIPSTWSFLPCGSVARFPQNPPWQSYCNMYSRFPHDLSEDQQMSSLQPANRIDLVFSEGSKCGRNECESQAS